MPGVLVIEAMAQAGAVLLFSAVDAHSSKDSKLVLFTGIERAKFRRPVVPGDQLRIEVEMRVWRGTAGRMAGMVYVGDKRAAEATISCRLVDRAKAMGGMAGESGEE
jgi:3-hydroxyacyl-[acyl-carrier-protein] dehydratase